jgi:hypothetical protein
MTPSGRFTRCGMICRAANPDTPDFSKDPIIQLIHDPRFRTSFHAEEYFSRTCEPDFDPCLITPLIHEGLRDNHRHSVHLINGSTALRLSKMSSGLVSPTPLPRGAPRESPRQVSFGSCKFSNNSRALSSRPARNSLMKCSKKLRIVLLAWMDQGSWRYAKKYGSINRPRSREGSISTKSSSY